MFKYLLLLTIAAHSCLDASGHGLGRKRAVFKKSAAGPIQGKDQAQQAAKLGLFGENAKNPANKTTMDSWRTLKNAGVFMMPFDVIEDDGHSLLVAALMSSDFADIDGRLRRIDGWRMIVQGMAKQHASVFPVYYWTLPFENQALLTAISCVEGAPMDFLSGHYVNKRPQDRHPLDGINNQRSFNVWTQTAKPVIFGEQFPAFMYSKKGRQPEGKQIIQNTGAKGLTLLCAKIKEEHVNYIADYPQLFEECIDAVPAGRGAAIADVGLEMIAAARFVASEVGQRAAVEFERKGWPMFMAVISIHDLQHNYNLLEEHILKNSPEGQGEFFLEHVLYFLAHNAQAEFINSMQRVAGGGLHLLLPVAIRTREVPALLYDALGAAEHRRADQLLLESGLLRQAVFAQLMIINSGKGQEVIDKALKSFNMLWPYSQKIHLNEKATNHNLLRYAVAPTLYSIPIDSMLAVPGLTVRHYAQAFLYHNVYCYPFEARLTAFRDDVARVAAPGAGQNPGAYTAALVRIIQNRFRAELANGAALHKFDGFLNEIEGVENRMNRVGAYIAQVDIPEACPTLGDVVAKSVNALPDNLIETLDAEYNGFWLNAAKDTIHSLAQSAALPSIYSLAISNAIQRRLEVCALCAENGNADAANPSLCDFADRDSLVLLAQWLLDSRHIAIRAALEEDLKLFIERHRDLHFVPKHPALPLTFVPRGMLDNRPACAGGQKPPSIVDLAGLSVRSKAERLLFFTELLNILMNEIAQYEA